jgi:hypothetical protein
MSGDNPYKTNDTPAEWGQVVRDYVVQRAEQTEELGGREGEYNSTLKDPRLADEFKAHAQQYSRALWRWATDDVPHDILERALGHTPTPDLPATEWLGYLLIRRETMDWWSIRGRTDQTPEALRTDAERMMQVTQFLSLACGLKDYELFEHLVKEKRQTRANRRPATIEFYLFQYWLAWSLWQGDHSSNLAVLKRRLNLQVSKSSMSKATTRLRLRP